MVKARSLIVAEQVKPTIVFLCVENSCRSQIAEAFGRKFARKTYEVKSAGSLPSGKVNPTAIKLMNELGYDISSHASTSINQLHQAEIEVIVSMGCGDVCPNILAKEKTEWEIPDPKEMSLSDFRKIRDLIKNKVEKLSLIHI